MRHRFGENSSNNRSFFSDNCNGNVKDVMILFISSTNGILLSNNNLEEITEMERGSFNFALSSLKS